MTRQHRYLVREYANRLSYECWPLDLSGRPLAESSALPAGTTAACQVADDSASGPGTIGRRQEGDALGRAEDWRNGNPAPRPLTFHVGRRVA